MERQFVIVTDSASDLPDEYFSERGVDCVRLGFVLDGVTYDENSETLPSIGEFYAKVRGGSMPTTFQISPEQALSHIEPPAAAGHDVLVLAFSSGLSGSFNSYCVAAEQLREKYPDRKLFVVDSLCASMGEGLFVDYVVKKADTGASIEETRDYAEDLKLHVCHEFTVDNLFHLKRGGRVSTAAAIVGTIFQVKPVLHVDDEGHLIVVKKAIGRKKSLHELVARMKERECLQSDDPIFISHGDCIDDVNYLISLLRAAFGEREILVNTIGSVIGAHSGPGTVALFYRGNKR